jgi:hypothetical protein
MDCSGSEAYAELPQNEAGPLLRPLRDQGDDIRIRSRIRIRNTGGWNNFFEKFVT